MGILRQIGFVNNDNSQAAKVFEELQADFRTVPYTVPHEYVSSYCTKYREYVKKNPGAKSLAGGIFECILATILVRENILPIYKSTSVAFVPNVIFDLLLYSSEFGPICISAKTSLRERYKQADLEAIALKYVHRKSLSYLVTLDAREASSVKSKIRAGDVIGLDDVVVADTIQFDDLINKLKSIQPAEPPTVKVIDSNFVITRDKIATIR